MNQSPQNDSNAFGGQNRTPESWNNLNNSGGNAGMRDQGKSKWSLYTPMPYCIGYYLY